MATFQNVFEYRWRQVGGRLERPCVEAASAPPPNATVRLIETDVRERSFKETIYHAVDHARHHIYLENPYFSDILLTAKLGAARRRGVDVRVIVTLRGNIPQLNRYVILTANRLVSAGVSVYLAPSMTHVKAMSIDGVWAYLGTGNFDELSLRQNHEVGLAVTSPSLVAELDRAVFYPDMAKAELLTARMPTPRNRLLLEVLALWY